MTSFVLGRSALYTPSADAAVLRKAARSAADVLILDLEDAVAPDAKDDARANVVGLLAEGLFAGRPVVVRVNGAATPWHEADVRALASSGVAALLLPKVGTVEDVVAAETLFGRFGVPEHVALWCMIETPLGVLNAHAIAGLAPRSASRMRTWVLGTNDLVKEMRGRPTPDRAAIVPLLVLALAAARVAGLHVYDGVYNDITDLDGFARECVQGRDLGFDGKTLIHPSQVGPCHAAYSPSDDEVAEARRIVAAFEAAENRAKAVLRIDGRMVELLHAHSAREVVAKGAAIAASDAKRHRARLRPERPIHIKARSDPPRSTASHRRPTCRKRF